MITFDSRLITSDELSKESANSTDKSLAHMSRRDAMIFKSPYSILSTMAAGVLIYLRCLTTGLDKATDNDDDGPALAASLNKESRYLIQELVVIPSTESNEDNINTKASSGFSKCCWWWWGIAGRGRRYEGFSMHWIE